MAPSQGLQCWRTAGRPGGVERLHEATAGPIACSAHYLHSSASGLSVTVIFQLENGESMLLSARVIGIVMSSGAVPWYFVLAQKD